MSDNNQPIFLHPQDAEIVELEGRKSLLSSSDGDVAFVFGNDFSDDQIMTALNFANMAYQKGVRVGGYRKEAEVQRSMLKAMGIKVDEKGNLTIKEQ